MENLLILEISRLYLVDLSSPDFFKGESSLIN